MRGETRSVPLRTRRPDSGSAAGQDDTVLLAGKGEDGLDANETFTVIFDFGGETFKISILSCQLFTDKHDLLYDAKDVTGCAHKATLLCFSIFARFCCTFARVVRSDSSMPSSTAFIWTMTASSADSSCPS